MFDTQLTIPDNLTNAANWERFVFGSYTQEQVQKAVRQFHWQATRLDMLGEPLEFKFEMLWIYLESRGYCEEAKICVTNYVYALKRGGLIK